MGPDGSGGGIRILRPAETLREPALDNARAAFLERPFRPGDRPVERNLCAELGVSRTVLHEVERAAKAAETPATALLRRARS